MSFVGRCQLKIFLLFCSNPAERGKTYNAEKMDVSYGGDLNALGGWRVFTIF
ncbi:MAG: hypothetical protein G01um10145_354 [Microgenomates group bacterium Gr01-1014_5]|nr:MAG: hypothetical protein G01um10145_354 [Microgenomates group bacterium Gr01-1014_5]